MPGGHPDAWPHVKDIFQAISAKVEDGSPCCDWVGNDGAGHYVKMVHNGIEYGDMQLICEAYHLMGSALGMGCDEMAAVFAEWNQGELDSYLIEITAAILAHKDTDGTPLVEKISDTAGQKGTGKWTGIEALEHGMPVTLIGTRAAPSKPRLLHAATSWPRHALTPPLPHPAALPSLRRGRLRALPLRAQGSARRRRQGALRAERRRDRGGGRLPQGGQGGVHRVDPTGAARLEDRQLRAGDGLPHRHHRHGHCHHCHCHRHHHCHRRHHHRLHHRRRRRRLLLTATSASLRRASCYSPSGPRVKA